MSYEYAIIVKSKTRLEKLIERFNTKAQAKFYIEQAGGNFNDYEVEDEIFNDALNSVQKRLTPIIKNKTIDKQYVPSYIFSRKNIIIVIGQDGLVANTAKYSRNLPIVAVNPDLDRYDGVLLPYNSSNCIEAVDQVISKTNNTKSVQFAEAKLNDGQRLLAFNDLFVGASSHVSARYKITFGKITEQQSSSGIIISTQAGATGWMSSIFNMANGLEQNSNNLKRIRLPDLGSNNLFFAVREPFKSIQSQINLTCGKIKKESLILESMMPNNGVIFSDGVESDFLKFNSGTIASIGVAKEKAQLVVKK